MVFQQQAIDLNGDQMPGFGFVGILDSAGHQLEGALDSAVVGRQVFASSGHFIEFFDHIFEGTPLAGAVKVKTN